MNEDNKTACLDEWNETTLRDSDDEKILQQAIYFKHYIAAF
jgi:hypothetical protein